ncbi:hypothetical protein P5673_001989 [Acropora cervicornis]|uniref:Uncharacterized protein n=1 Tax=Acropora cervicornis TaxID=6130 RepID=A0AAD9R4H4_ACRCE|nr:hypothetical protein P5673_001989 [Acropora cervicornis]
MEKIFKGLGSITGKFYNTHQAWSQAPEWEYPPDAAKMGMKIAKSAGIEQEYGVAFASGFLGTANLK